MRQPITDQELAPLAERYGDRWKIWRSNPDGWYACASRRSGPPWAAGMRPGDGVPEVPATLVEDSVGELAEALERADAAMRSARARGGEGCS